VRPRGLRALANSVGAGLLDQALASGVNFLTIILVARAAGPREFGYFALVFTLLQSLGALQLALVTRPHNVLAASRKGNDYIRFTTTTVGYQLMFTALAACALLLGGAIAGAAGFGRTTLLYVAAPTLVAWQLQELGRRILYTEGRLRDALANDAVSYGAQAVAFIALYASDNLTAVRALAIVGITSAIAVGMLAVQLRSSLGRTVERAALRESWRFGRWLGAAEAAYWFESQYYVYLVAAMITPAAAGILKAAQTLLGPVSVFLAFFVNYLPVRFARRLGERPVGARALVRDGLALTVPPVLAYGVLVAVAAPWLLRVVYGTAYSHDATAVRLFALYYVCLANSDVVIAALSARRRTRRVFAGHVAGALVSLAAGWAFVRAYGAAGAVGAMIVAIVVAFAVFVSDRGPARPHTAAA
jgi:O-antigen/teichoic acid export membrane protein